MWKQRDTGNPFNEVRFIKGEKYDLVAVFNCSDINAEHAFIGVNTAGLAVMNNMSYNIGDGEGDDNGVIMRLALARCATIDEFEAFIKENLDKYSLAANFGAIDSYGGAAYIEAGGDKCIRYDVPEGSWLVRTNYSLAGDGTNFAGTARYKTAEHVMTSHKGKFSVDDLIDGLGRSYFNEVTGVNAIHRNHIALDRDFIARPTTVSSVCIEGVTPSERKDASIMWSATGFTPCCYAVPVWIAAGDDIPSFLQTDEEEERLSANRLAHELKGEVHPADADIMGQYIDFRILKPIMRLVRKAEATEYKKGYETDALIRREFDSEKVSAFNREAESRYKRFIDQVKPE